MPEHLPEVIDPIGLAEKGRRLTGVIAIDRLDRVLPLLARHDGQVEVDLRFFKEGRQPIVQGSVKTLLWLTCQCCLEALSWPIETNLQLGVVSSIDSALKLPDSLEALVVEADGVVVLADIVQDELLLAIPVIPQHPACDLPTGEVPGKKVRPNPFEVLRDLKLN